MSASDLASLSWPVIAGLGLLLVVELGLMIWGVVDWAKRPADQVRGNRILWLPLILFVNIIGPIVYLTAGRKPAPLAETTTRVASDSAQAAVDSLYGSSHSDDGRG